MCLKMRYTMVYGIPQKNDFNEKIEMMINPGIEGAYPIFRQTQMCELDSSCQVGMKMQSNIFETTNPPFTNGVALAVS